MSSSTHQPKQPDNQLKMRLSRVLRETAILSTAWKSTSPDRRTITSSTVNGSSSLEVRKNAYESHRSTEAER